MIGAVGEPAGEGVSGIPEPTGDFDAGKVRIADDALRWFGPAGMGPTGPSAVTQAPYFFFFLAAFFFAIVSPPSRSARVVRS
jgi:hypothetical protein